MTARDLLLTLLVVFLMIFGTPAARVFAMAVILVAAMMLIAVLIWNRTQ